MKRFNYKRANIIIVAVFAIGGLVQAGTITVGSERGNYDFHNIQDGIDAAEDGDIVLVAPKEYEITEPITFRGKAITVRSEEGPEQTMIRMSKPPMGWNAEYALVLFDNGEDYRSLLEGFTLRGSPANGVLCLGSSPRLENCVMTSNTSRGVRCLTGSSPTIAYCKIIGNRDGGVKCEEYSSPTITHCILSRNWGDSGVFCVGFCSPTITNCIISGNKNHLGAGVRCQDSSSPTIINCLISGNLAPTAGGGVFVGFSSATITNCTISGNSAGEGDGVYCENSSLTLTNCILWDGDNEIFDLYNSNSKTMITYSNIKGGFPGDGNIDIEPLFVEPGYWINVKDPNAFWINGDYHLKSEAGRWDPNSKIWVADGVTSPCIDAGDPNSNWFEELWPHGGRINMGAYGGMVEASMSLSQVGDARDFNNDGLITWDDVLMLADKWDSNYVPLKENLDLDGVVDANDLNFYSDWSIDSNNTAPVIDVIEDQNTVVGNELSFVVSAIDDDSDDLTYLALGLPHGATFEEQMFIWTQEQAGTYLVTFVVSDYKSLDYLTVQITVED